MCHMKNISLRLLLLFYYVGFAQVGVGTTNPAAALDITSANNGLLIPRVSLTAKNVTTPVVNPQGGALANATLVYNTATSGVAPNNVTPGFYFWETATLNWKPLAGSGSGWNLSGNAGTNPATHFVGTTDNVDIVFKRNNARIGYLGSTNVSFGPSALNAASSGINNIAIGVSPMFANTTGGYNIAVGLNAMRANQIGSFNTAVGNLAMQSSIDGQSNAAFGDLVLAWNISGNENAGFGTNAVMLNTTGNGNSGFGVGAIQFNATGNHNTAIGSFAMSNLLSGDGNIAVGYFAQVPTDTGSNQMSIANVIYGTDMTSATDGKIGIGTSAPAAKFDIQPSSGFAPANTDGIIIPRVANFPATNPTAAQNGMMIFLTTQFGGNIPGFYYWDNPSTSWKGITDTKLPYVTTGAAAGIYTDLMSEYTVRVFNGVSDVRLPNAVGNTGKVFVIIGSNGISAKAFSTSGGGIYDDVTNTNVTTLAANERYTVQSDGTNWIVIGR